MIGPKKLILDLIHGRNPEPPLRTDQLTVQFTLEDFEPALRKAAIDPATITQHEWSKFTDAFLAGTHWDEVAEYATDAIKAQRDTL